MNEKRRWLPVAALAALASVSGCKSNHLIFTTYTKVGLDVSTTDGQPTSALFGYKRFEGAIIPVDVDEQEMVGDPEIPKDARSVYAAIDLENSWLQGLKIYQVFATGEAATQAANSPDKMREIIEGLRNNQDDDDGDEEDEE